MSVQSRLEERVDEVLHSNSVSQAQQVIRSRTGMVVLAAISFFESALPVPILTDPFLVAAILLNRAQAIRLVIVTTASSVLGGVMAYVTATYFLESLLRWMTPGIVEHFERLIAGSEESTFILTLLGAITPVPYTLVAWAVAVIEGGVLVFVLASILGRGVRYGIIGYCVYRFGPLATQYAKRYIGVTSVVVVLALALLVWIKM